MAHTLTLLLTHVVFSTKERRPWLDDALRADVFAYLGGIARETGATAPAINGTADHVHLLVARPPALALADLVRLLKTNSALWLHREHRRTHVGIAWQAGCGAFSVCHSAQVAVIQYSVRQKEHHRASGLPKNSSPCSASATYPTTNGSCSAGVDGSDGSLTPLPGLRRL